MLFRDDKIRVINHPELGVYTVVEVKGDMVCCFRYDYNDMPTGNFKIDEVEKI